MPRGERELGRGPQERTRCPGPTGAQQSHQEDPEAGVTSRGSPHPERAGQSLDPGDRASKRARDRYSRVRAEAQVADSEDSRDTRGRKAWAEGRASLEPGDLSSPRPGGLVTTEAETWAGTPSSGAGVFPPGELTPPDPSPKRSVAPAVGGERRRGGRVAPLLVRGTRSPTRTRRGQPRPETAPPAQGLQPRGGGQAPEPREGGHLRPGAPPSFQRGANTDAERGGHLAPSHPTGARRGRRAGPGAGADPRAPPRGVEEGGGRAGAAPRPADGERRGRAGAGAPRRPCRDRRRGRRGGRRRGRRPTAPREEGKGSGPVEPDALTTGAGAAAEERIATGGGGERPPPYSRAPGPGAIAIAARSGSGVGGSGPGVVLTTGSGLKGGRGVCRRLRGS